jgi:hypothetical protein
VSLWVTVSQAELLQVAKLQASDKSLGQHFARSVSISGDRVIVGAPDEGPNWSAMGAAYVFERGAGGKWNEVAKLQASDRLWGGHFGTSVSISGDWAIVGALNEDTFEPEAGAAYVFERNVGGTWSEVAKLRASDNGEWDEFGCAVSISSDRAIVGARRNHPSGVMAGAAYVFDRDAGGTWSEVAKLVGRRHRRVQSWRGVPVRERRGWHVE